KNRWRRLMGRGRRVFVIHGPTVLTNVLFVMWRDGRSRRCPPDESLSCSTMAAMPKVTFIGAGSAVFARQLMTDILGVDGLDEGEFALVDIDARRLKLAGGIAERLVELSGKAWR